MDRPEELIRRSAKSLQSLDRKRGHAPSGDARFTGEQEFSISMQGLVGLLSLWSNGWQLKESEVAVCAVRALDLLHSIVRTLILGTFAWLGSGGDVISVEGGQLNLHRLCAGNRFLQRAVAAPDKPIDLSSCLKKLSAACMCKSRLAMATQLRASELFKQICDMVHFHVETGGMQHFEGDGLLCLPTLR